LIFYTTGEVIRPVMASANASPDNNPQADDAAAPASYTPYAVREGIYQRGWDSYLKLLTQFWQPYLDGHSSFDDAVAHMVSAL
jgi:hypothetical protein